MPLTRHILIIDDNIDDVELCRRMLARVAGAPYELTHAKTGTGGLDQLRIRRPDCVLLDYSLPGHDGRAVLASIRELHPYLPVVILTGQGNEAIATRFMQEGAQDYIVKADISEVYLHKVIGDSIQHAAEREARNGGSSDEAIVLIIDDNPDDREHCIRLLKKIANATYHFVEASSGQVALEKIAESKPDCILLDYSLPGKNGLEILKQVSELHPYLSVIMMTGQGNEALAVQAIKSGAHHYLIKGGLQPDVLYNAVRSAIEHSTLERRMAEKEAELAASYRLNEAIMASARHLIISTDPQGVVTSFNRASENALGYSAEEVVGNHTPALWHDKEEVAKRADELSRESGQRVEPGFDVFIVNPCKGAPESTEWTLIRKDGSTFPVHLTATCIRDAEENILGFLGVIEDVTAFKEEERRRNELQQAMQLAVEGVSKLDAQGRYLYVNNAYAEKIGYTPEELSGQSWEMTIHDDEHEKMQVEYRKMLADGKVVAETVGRCKDGSTLYIQVTMISDHNQRGEFIGHYCFMQDISERKHQEELKQRLIAQLMESNTELERFAYIASHDMQEPIRMITRFSEIIAEEYDPVLGDTGKEYLKMVLSSGVRLRHMIEDLLAYSRLGDESRQMGAFDGENALACVLENLQEVITERNAVITHDPMPVLHGNSIHFIRLMQNLISNAIKYQPKGNQPQIHIGVEDQGDRWCVSVRDNGLGVKEEYIEQIFQPFRRLHTWDKIQGTGLGLAICRKLAENNGGKIWATSAPGKGSIFYFTLSKRMISEPGARCL